MIIIGISGKARSGKDTVADILVRKYGFIKIAFADSLKDIVRHHYGFSSEDLWTDTKTKEVRRILQGTGELIKSLEGEDFWIREVQRRIVYKSMTTGWTGKIVIPDVRFFPEMDFVKGGSGIIVRVERPNKEDIEFNPGHISEQELPGYDYTIINHLDIEYLESEIATIMRNENINP